MEIDRNTINTLLSLDDARLKFVIDRLASGVGIDLDAFGLRKSSVAEIRKKLASLSDAELELARRQIKEKNGG